MWLQNSTDDFARRRLLRTSDNDCPCDSGSGSLDKTAYIRLLFLSTFMLYTWRIEPFWEKIDSHLLPSLIPDLWEFQSRVVSGSKNCAQLPLDPRAVWVPYFGFEIPSLAFEALSQLGRQSTISFSTLTVRNDAIEICEAYLRSRFVSCWALTVAYAILLKARQHLDVSCCLWCWFRHSKMLGMRKRNSINSIHCGFDLTGVAAGSARIRALGTLGPTFLLTRIGVAAGLMCAPDAEV